MTRMLSELLGVKDLNFRLSIEQLEKASGRPSADIRLSTEIMQNAQQKIRLLGLDPTDTTPQELYEALMEKVRGDNDRLESALIHQKENNRITAGSIAKTLQAVSMPKSCFGLKHSVAKRLLKADSPKNTLKKLGYRSLDSLLKREPITAVFVAAHLIEPINWQKKLTEQYKQLKPTDFETREIEILAPKTTRWQALVSELAARQRSPLAISKELGGLVLLPVPLDMPASTIATLLLALQAINDIRIDSTFCKLQQVKNDFGEIVANTLRDKSRAQVLIGGQPLPWYVIQKHYSSFSANFPLELFEPHVHQEDLQLVQIEDVLSYIEPTLDFWQKTNYLGVSSSKQTVSLNIIDVAVNSCNRLNFAHRTNASLRQNLWAELLLRYLQETELEHAVVTQLDAKLVGNNEEQGYSVAFAQ